MNKFCIKFFPSLFRTSIMIFIGKITTLEFEKNEVINIILSKLYLEFLHLSSYFIIFTVKKKKTHRLDLIFDTYFEPP